MNLGTLRLVQNLVFLKTLDEHHQVDTLREVLSKNAREKRTIHRLTEAGIFFMQWNSKIVSTIVLKCLTRIHGGRNAPMWFFPYFADIFFVHGVQQEKTTCTRWRLKKDFVFSPLPRKMVQIDSHFQVGWNHPPIYTPEFFDIDTKHGHIQKESPSPNHNFGYPPKV